MQLAATTVTIYFIGLVTFYQPPGATNDDREVIVPMAKAVTSHLLLPLARHEAKVEIEKLTGGSTTCGTIPGGKYSEDPSEDTCTVTIGTSGITIKLPASGTGLSLASNFAIPKLTSSSVCPAISRIKNEYLTNPSYYAVRMKADQGTLHPCRDGSAWGTKLALTDSGTTYPIEIAGKSVTLDPGAVITVKNTAAGASTWEIDHFWWYYKMFEGSAACMKLPCAEPGSAIPACPVSASARHHGDLWGASGIGCSNTDYP